MPVRRNADGDIVDERTRRGRESDRIDPAAGGDDRTPDRGGVAPTVRVDRGAAATRGGAGEAGRYGTATTRRADGGSMTQIYRPGAKQPAGEATPTGSRRPGAPALDPMADPPVGWLVVVAGPGKGNVATLGIGVNAIGRDRTARVSLDYGDQAISRTGHASITYDPRGRKFYVQHGGGTNLTYVDDEPVLVPRELEPLAQVQMGDTVLRFVPLCGPGFSWEEDKPNEG